MPLVDYSDSDNEPHDNVQKSQKATDLLPATTKRKRDNDDLPALPSKFHDLYASTSRLSMHDDPSLHGGRKRITPHIAGNWPTHLYIEWYPSTVEHELLSSIISTLQKLYKETRIDSSLSSDLGTPLPLHISLSHPIGFSTEQKDNFATTLKNSIISLGIRPFKLSPLAIDWVPNSQKTRWFLVLRLQRPNNNSLNKLLHVSNKVVQRFGQPPLYATPVTSTSLNSEKQTTFQQRASLPADTQDLTSAFHVSIAWTLEAPSTGLITATSSVLGTSKLAKVSNISILVKEMKVKIGNTIMSIPLQEKVNEGTGLF